MSTALAYMPLTPCTYPGIPLSKLQSERSSTQGLRTRCSHSDVLLKAVLARTQKLRDLCPVSATYNSVFIDSSDTPG